MQSLVTSVHHINFPSEESVSEALVVNCVWGAGVRGPLQDPGLTWNVREVQILYSMTLCFFWNDLLDSKDLEIFDRLQRMRTDLLLSSHPLSTHKVCRWLWALDLQTLFSWPQQTPGAAFSPPLTCAHSHPRGHQWCRRDGSQQQTVCHRPPPPQRCRFSLWPHWSLGSADHWYTRQCPSPHDPWWRSNHYLPQLARSEQRTPRPQAHDTEWEEWTRAGHWPGLGQEAWVACSSVLLFWLQACQLWDSSIEESFQNQNRGHQRAFSGDMKLLPEIWWEFY